MGPEGLSDEPLPGYLNGLVGTVVLRARACVCVCTYRHYDTIHLVFFAFFQTFSFYLGHVD